MLEDITSALRWAEMLTLCPPSQHCTNLDKMSSMKRSRLSKLSVEDFYRVGQDIQNQTGCALADKSKDKLL